LLDRAKELEGRKHEGTRTEEVSICWMVRYIHFLYKRHPKDMGVPEIEAFLTHALREQGAQRIKSPLDC
jgi:hypothetical protein